MSGPALYKNDADAVYRVRFFGPFRFERVDGERLAPLGRKTRAMLAYLLLTGGAPVSRETLAALLWGERGEEQARGSLRYALHELRELAHGDTPLLSIQRSEVQVDLGRMESDLGRLRALSSGADAETLGWILGEQPRELLSDLGSVDPAFDSWLATERSRRHEERRVTAIAVARRALAAGTAQSAYDVSVRLLSAEPYDELATQLAMETSRHLGDRDGVRRAFAQYADALRREVDAAPPAEMIALRDRLTASTAALALGLVTSGPAQTGSAAGSNRRRPRSCGDGRRHRARAGRLSVDAEIRRPGVGAVRRTVAPSTAVLAAGHPRRTEAGYRPAASRRRRTA